MRFSTMVAVAVAAGLTVIAGAQVASHAPTTLRTKVTAQPAPAAADPALDKAVARVNGAALSERELRREMYAMFPYADQHNGLPKGMEPEIRKGALEMIIFEELVYQEAQRRHMIIAPERLAKAESDFRKQFKEKAAYEQFLRAEMHGSQQELRQDIRRALLIEDLLKVEVQKKSAVPVEGARKFYDQNAKRFEHGESFSLQTISLIPPKNAGLEVQKEARKRAEDALRQAKATKSYREFGLLAEKLSDDDWHVNMGDRKTVEASNLPPQLVEMARKMKVGEVSDLLQLGPNFTLFRMNAHTPAHKDTFPAVQKQIQAELQKVRVQQLQAELHQKLRKNAKVEVL